MINATICVALVIFSLVKIYPAVNNGALAVFISLI